MYLASPNFDVFSIKRILPASKLKDVFPPGKKLNVFTNKGTECVHCGRVGSILLQMELYNKLFWQLCDKDFVDITLDHIRPRSKGGTNNESNLQPLCSYCNNAKSDAVNDHIALKKKVIKIEEISGAEHIELIYLNGYKTYAEKSKYNVGDVVIFIKPNSWIPQELHPAPGESKIYMGVCGWRLKKKKIMKIPVAGMILPLSILDGKNYNNANIANLLNINPYVPARGQNHIDSIVSRHKKLKNKILDNIIDIIDPEALEIIRNEKD